MMSTLHYVGIIKMVNQADGIDGAYSMSGIDRLLLEI